MTHVKYELTVTYDEKSNPTAEEVAAFIKGAVLFQLEKLISSGEIKTVKLVLGR